MRSNSRIEGANQRLTLAGRVSRLGVEPGGAGDAVADAVAHVAAGRGLEAVDNEAGAVAHAQRQLGDAALPVTRDAARGVDRSGRHGGDLACCGRERALSTYVERNSNTYFEQTGPSHVQMSAEIYLGCAN